MTRSFPFRPSFTFTSSPFWLTAWPGCSYTHIVYTWLVFLVFSLVNPSACHPTPSTYPGIERGESASESERGDSESERERESEQEGGLCGDGIVLRFRVTSYANMPCCAVLKPMLLSCVSTT